MAEFPFSLLLPQLPAPDFCIVRLLLLPPTHPVLPIFQPTFKQPSIVFAYIDNESRRWGFNPPVINYLLFFYSLCDLTPEKFSTCNVWRESNFDRNFDRNRFLEMRGGCPLRDRVDVYTVSRALETISPRLTSSSGTRSPFLLFSLDNRPLGGTGGGVVVCDRYRPSTQFTQPRLSNALEGGGTRKMKRGFKV